MIKNLFDPVFLAEVIVIIGFDELQRYYKRKKVGDELQYKNVFEGFCQKIEETKKDGKILIYYIICLENKNNFYTLQHEIIHLVKNVFVDRGIAFREENDEVIAYYHNYWFKKIWRLINTTKKP